VGDAARAPSRCSSGLQPRKLTVGEHRREDAERFTDARRVKEAAERAMADALVKGLPQGYLTQLEKAFRGATS
jgi:hypothetical protein